jgi:integrase
VLLGRYGSAASKEAYNRTIAEWFQTHDKPHTETEVLTVNKLILSYWKYASDYYGFGQRHRGDEFCLRYALSIVRELYGRTPAIGFGPLALKACRQKMIECDWSRTYINSQVDKIRRMFRWAASEELLPSSVYNDLRTVPGLRFGKTEARETKKVRPVAMAHVEATLPFMPRVVQAMVRFELLTGCRPAEVCALRPIDLDTTNASCWLYRPGSDEGHHGHHKTAIHGHDRVILIGPKAQEVLRPYLGTRQDAFCFCPAESEAARNGQRREQRRSPITPSQTARGAKGNRRRAPGDRYVTLSYRNAIYRACDRAYPLPEHLRPPTQENGRREGRIPWWKRLTAEEKEAVRSWRREHRWHPNQLRHSRATELRPYGLDVVKTILGHTKVETTQVYSEKDMAAAMDVVAHIG